ncbi:aluminum-activated malate transporter 10-like [Eucalyptus grandis]|uniref:aluminum-activated malate transporter 10-like n=1 Tax=Eucalyptus grandis TaxID=71139 RepID=UPI00192EEBB2|nr:aluminum-activated malate transporter 10-like [Eucalyptus grandis]
MFLNFNHWAIQSVCIRVRKASGDPTNVSSTLPKSINGVTGTFVAGSLGIGEHCMASQSGETFKPVILGISVFATTSAATFSRFMPSVKAQFNYGAMMFILTFSLVLLSGYRVDKLFEVANQRLSTRVIGTSLCILVGVPISPIRPVMNFTGSSIETWRSSLNLSKSTFRTIRACFRANRDNSKKTQACQWVLNSKASEESTHPWKEYLKIGALLHNRACFIEALNEIAARIEDIVGGVVELAELAEFKASNEDKMAQTQSASNKQSSDNPSSKTEPWRPFQRPEFISTSHLREISRLA